MTLGFHHPLGQVVEPLQNYQGLDSNHAEAGILVVIYHPGWRPEEFGGDSSDKFDESCTHCCKSLFCGTSYDAEMSKAMVVFHANFED